MYEEFASERESAMSKLDSELLPVVRRALRDYKAGTAWYAPIVDKALEIGGDAVDGKVLRENLAHTKDPENTSGETDERLAKIVSTYIVNAQEHMAGEEPGSTKTWITRHDDRVRHTHQDLDGKTIPTSERFDVGGIAKLRFPGEPVGDPEAWIHCRCVLKTTKGSEMTLTADVGPNTDPENEIPKPDPADLPAENPADPKVDDDTTVPFHGVATVTDKPTGDNRQLARDGFAKRPLPLPLLFQRAQSEGHAGATVVGQFTRMEINDAGEVEYDGHFNFTPEASEAIQGVAEGWLRGVSVDLDDVIIDVAASQPTPPAGMSEIELAEWSQTVPTVFKQWRVAGLTMVAIPAFYQGYIALGPRTTDSTAPAAQEDQALAASAISTIEFAPGTHDGPGWITDPVPTGRIRRYWTHGEGAAKIKWGVPGDFNRCRTQLGKYIANPEWLAGACANMHKEATGGWPGHAPTEAGLAERGTLVAAGARVAAAFNLVASAGPRELPPVEWFQNPGLDAPTPITIEGDHIFGHIATWSTCHIGQPGMCTTAPHSATDYAWFRLGAVETVGGLVPVGQITMDTGHADLRANRGSAAAHYDNTGTAVADVAAGEDEHGIWFSGRVRRGVSEDQRDALLGAKLSGDWREVRGNLELVAALAVNTPGFGIPRMGLAASADLGQTALVAAGLVDETTEIPVVHPNFDEIVRAGVVAELDRRERRAKLSDRTARLRQLADIRRQSRVQAARERFGRDV